MKRFTIMSLNYRGSTGDNKSRVNIIYGKIQIKLSLFHAHTHTHRLALYVDNRFMIDDRKQQFPCPISRTKSQSMCI